jgi:RNA-directed DNA polymerase
MNLATQIARSLQLSELYVLAVARSASHRYKMFTIRKADGKSDRLIEQPSKSLKLLQRWVVRRIFAQLPTHPAAHAYVEGRSIATNAEVHRKGRYISRLDFRNFFPSLTSADIESLVKSAQVSVGDSILGDEDIHLVCQLVCRFGRLTIGAPSSPMISNKLLFDLDAKLTQVANNRDALYTRYADDLYFSSFKPGVLRAVCKEAEEVIVNMPSPKLTINTDKTYHASRKRRMVVTSLRITPDEKVSVGRELKRKIRAVAHKAQTNQLGPQDRAWLRGMLAYVSSIEPEYAQRIRAKYRLD